MNTVIGKNGDPVERAIVFRKIHPAFGGELLGHLPFEADANDMRRGVLEAAGG